MKVPIRAKSNLYPEPNMEWGITKSDLIKKLGKPSNDGETVIGYNNYSENAPIVMYQFNNKGKLILAMVMVPSSKSENLPLFLAERYYYIGKENRTALFINSLSVKTASLAVGVEQYNPRYIRIFYTPMTPDKKSAKLNNIDANSINQLINNLK